MESVPRINKTVGFSMPPDLIGKIDARARSLGLNRSSYVQQLIRRDLEGKGIFSEDEAAVYAPLEADAAQVVRESTGEKSLTVSVDCDGFENVSPETVEQLETGIAALLRDILDRYSHG